MKIDVLNIYLPLGVCRHMWAGKEHRFFSHVVTAFQGIGFTVNILEDTDDARFQSMSQNAYAMFHYKDPFHDHALDARSAYIGPFYKLESETYRQDFRTANKVFKPQQIDQQVANKFFNIWQKRVVGNDVVPSPHPGCVLVALQGKLTRKRVGQSMSPIDMIHTTLRLEKTRDIVIKKHPKEEYASEELEALAGFETNPRVHFSDGDLNSLLAECDYVVAQNSSVTLKGLFHKKPGILFAHAEFHHPFQNIMRADRPMQCFKRVLKHPPNFQKYIYWYLQRNCINTSRDWVQEMILGHCREFGWQV